MGRWGLSWWVNLEDEWMLMEWGRSEGSLGFSEGGVRSRLLLIRQRFGLYG